ncbi:MAG: hypothetical protein ACHQAY_11505, partial [Hyphomicrobiales bacterium]
PSPPLLSALAPARPRSYLASPPPGAPHAQTGFHAAAYARAIEAVPLSALCPSGGAFAQNPYFCMGLVNAAEAVLQVSRRAGAVQMPHAHLAAAHGAHGFAQQGNAVAIFEGA